MTRLEDGAPVADRHGLADEARLVTRMGTEMHAKLWSNRHKLHWRHESVTDSYLLNRLVEEVQELALARPADRWAEAADVANIAAMLADRGQP